MGEPLMGQKKGQPSCITRGGFKPTSPHGRALSWIQRGDLAPTFSLLEEREGLCCPSLHFSAGIPQRCL